MNSILDNQAQKDFFRIPAIDFKAHILLEDNDRIIFSGKFGIGKTYFLKEFFRDDVQEKILGKILYNPIHLYPVNYSIAANEDIYRYLKYDLITSLAIKGTQLKEADFHYLDLLPSFVRANYTKVFATLLSMVPKVGGDIKEAYSNFKKLQEEFLAHTEPMAKSEGDKLVEYLTEIENKEGSLFENNIISQLICNILTRQKKETDRENILIIDDLDRIDPEHIFRILNVFAAHLDRPGSLSNKLGFDKVILVADIDNIKNIFKAKYGTETDFNGYIDKFYTTDVYHFDNRPMLRRISSVALRSIQIYPEQRQPELQLERIFKKSELGIDLLLIFIHYGMISLRSLLSKIQFKTRLYADQELVFSTSQSVYQFHFPILVQLKIVKELVGGYQTLSEFVNKIPSRSFLVTNINSTCSQMIYFVNFQKCLRSEGNIDITFDNREFRLAVPAHPTENLEHIKMRKQPVPGEWSDYDFTQKDFKEILLEFIQVLRRVDN